MSIMKKNKRVVINYY